MTAVVKLRALDPGATPAGGARNASRLTDLHYDRACLSYAPLFVSGQSLGARENQKATITQQE